MEILQLKSSAEENISTMGTSSMNAVNIKSVSYTKVVSEAVANSVKKALSKTIEDRKNWDHEKSSLILYSLSENQHNRQDEVRVLMAISLLCAYCLSSN